MPYRDDPFAKPVEVTTIKVKLPWYRFGRPYKDRLVQHVKVVPSEWDPETDSQVSAFHTARTRPLEIVSHTIEIEYCRKWEIAYADGYSYQYQLMDGSFVLMTHISVEDDSDYSGTTGWVQVWRGHDFGEYTGPWHRYLYGGSRHFRVGLPPRLGDFSTYTLEFGNISRSENVILAGKRIKHGNYDVAKLPELPAEKVRPNVFMESFVEKAAEYARQTIEADVARVKADAARIKEEARGFRKEVRSKRKKRKVPEYEKALVRVAEATERIGGLGSVLGSDISVTENEVVITKNGKTTIIRNGEVVREDE